MSYTSSLAADEDLAGALAQSLHPQLDHLPSARRNMVLLLVAANVAEAAAYDLATGAPPESTAALILAAAELDRLAERQRRRVENLPAAPRAVPR